MILRAVIAAPMRRATHLLNLLKIVLIIRGRLGVGELFLILLFDRNCIFLLLLGQLSHQPFWNLSICPSGRDALLVVVEFTFQPRSVQKAQRSDEREGGSGLRGLQCVSTLLRT